MISPPPPRLRRETGLAAIEFALVFPIFFLLFYGLVTWAFTLILQQSMTFAAQSAARAALSAKLEDVPPATHRENATRLARAEAGRALDWLPPGWKSSVLGRDNEKVEVAITRDGADWWIQVTTRYADFGTQPVLPPLTLPGGATFPPVPDQLIGQALLRL